MATYKNNKIDPFELIIVVLMIVGLGYFTYDVKSTHATLKAEKELQQKEQISNDNIIEGKDIYIRLQEYGYRLSAVDNIIMYKDSRVNWYEFLLDFRKEVPEDVTFTTQSYSEETGQISTQVIAPTEARLLEALKEIEEFEGLVDVDFNNINQEKISFLNDKRKYKGYSTTFTAFLDEKYLNDRYELIRNYKKLKYHIGDSENVMDLTRDIPLVTEGGILEGTGSIENELEEYIDDTEKSEDEENGYIDDNLTY